MVGARVILNIKATAYNANHDAVSVTATELQPMPARRAPQPKVPWYLKSTDTTSYGEDTTLDFQHN
jgi:hypothetical protein